ncbi:hypothetical protein KKD20_01420 [Patescibacteria group bacterium]|nr:hypothetical protein [Patescibacteria group bacterium]
MKFTVTLGDGDCKKEVEVEIPDVITSWEKMFQREMNRAYHIGLADGLIEGLKSEAKKFGEFLNRSI